MDEFIRQHLKDDNSDFKLNFIKEFVPDYKFKATDIEFYFEFWDSVVVYKMFTLEELNFILSTIDFLNFIDIYDFEIKNYIILTSQEDDKIDVYVSNKTFGKIFSNSITNMLLMRLKKTILYKVFGEIPKNFNKEIIPTDKIIKEYGVENMVKNGVENGVENRIENRIEKPSCIKMPYVLRSESTSTDINSSDVERVIRDIEGMVHSDGEISDTSDSINNEKKNTWSN